MAANDQKLRTLYLMQILLEETDEDHIMNASQLIEQLNMKYGMDADRRTIYSDIEVLERFGLSITQLKGKTPGYYVDSRDFELAELKLLVDAVQSSKFITEKKTRESGFHRCMPQRNCFCLQERKYTGMLYLRKRS